MTRYTAKVMGVDDEEHLALLKEVKKIRREIESRPDDVALRIRLIQIQLRAGQPQSAWHNCIHILDRDPVNVEALRLAKQAAETVGHRRAEEYARRLAALSGPAGRGGRMALRLIQGGLYDSDAEEDDEDERLHARSTS